MKRRHFSIHLPVMVLHKQQMLETDIRGRQWMGVGLSYNGTLIILAWDIIASLAAPHYGTFSHLRRYSPVHCSAPSLTLAEIFRGLTWQKTSQNNRLTMRQFINRLNKGLLAETLEHSASWKAPKMDTQ